MQHEGKGDPCSALLLGRRRVSRARRGGCRSWGFCWWIGSRHGKGSSSKVPLTRLSVAVATIATLVVVVVGRFGLGCSSVTGSHSGTTGIIDGRTGVARTVAVDVSRLPAVQAEVVAA